MVLGGIIGHDNNRRNEKPGYKGANNPLWGLHKLDIDDKHKFIVPTFSLSKIICEGISYDRLHPQPDKDIVKGGSFLHIVIDGVDHIVIGGKRLKDGDIVTTVLGPEISNYQINIKTNIAIHEPGGAAPRRSFHGLRSSSNM